MPALGDYIGHLLTAITSARLQADLESVRIAQLYASHPLLQHMPVPRFRLPNVTLDLPVAVDKIDEPVTPDLATIRKNINSIVEDTLKQQQIKVSSGSRALVRRNLDTLLAEFSAVESRDSRALGEASERAVGVVMDALKAAAKDGSSTIDPQVESSLRRRLALEYAKLQPPPPTVQVLVNTSQLKDVGPPQNLTRIRLTISEEGVEWTQPNPDDASSKTLLPE